MYAIFETGGKQFKVEEGEEISIEKIAVDEGETVTFNNVLFVGGDETTVGAPLIDGASVTAKVIQQGKGKKLTVFKYKAKKNYRRKQGHRQPFTRLSIDKISL